MSQKILVIDDSLATSKTAESVLSQQFGNVDVLLAQRGAEALERFLVTQPDLVLLNESLPDMDGDTVCYRLLNDPLTSQVPVVVMATNGRGEALRGKYANVVNAIPKPVTSEALLSAVKAQLGKAASTPSPTASILFRDASKIVFAGHTGFFSLRSALQMACGDKLTGVLRVFINRFPVELFISGGRFLFATTRNFHLYLQASPVILNATNLGTILDGQAGQAASGCPLFLFLAARNGFPHDDVVQLTREHGQRLFSHLWTAGRVNFEFAELSEFPEFAQKFPAASDDPDNWVLASLRYVSFDSLTASQRPDPNGSPAYTRKGYDLIQHLRLNDVETRFATAINGSEPLQQIAKRIKIALNDALLIVFRFQALEIIDYWSSTVLSLPIASAPSGGKALEAGS
ncbi:MAG: two-component system, cell cycle response regulator [Chthoniobacter sp.]|nr:two-component system, cell cycle response regulator [Chthoniobacter sp.]